MLSYIATVFLCAVAPDGHDFCMSQSDHRWFPSQAACAAFHEEALPLLEDALSAKGHKLLRVETGCVAVDRRYSADT